jgi:hypothetical protein
LPPQGFGPRGPKPEEAYIEVSARNMIGIYTGYIPEAEKFKFFPRRVLAPEGQNPKRHILKSPHVILYDRYIYRVYTRGREI